MRVTWSVWGITISQPPGSEPGRLPLTLQTENLASLVGLEPTPHGFGDRHPAIGIER